METIFLVARHDPSTGKNERNSLLTKNVYALQQLK
jgi:hypothetical protein